MPPKKKRKARVLEVAPGRFSNGLDWVSAGYAETPSGPGDPTAIHFEVVRPDDLVALSIDAIGCELLTDGKRPAHLRPIASHSFPRLVVRHAFQHVGEEASYEGQAGRRIVAPDFWGPQPPTEHPVEEPNHTEPNPPVNGMAARASRLVFRIPAGTDIEFSTRGILAALSELELHVHDLARPGDAPLAGRSGRGTAIPPVLSPYSPTELVVGRYVATVSDNALTLARARRTRRGPELPPAGSLARTAYEARELRRARVFLQSRPAVFEMEASAREARTVGDLLGERPSIRPDIARFISERSRRPQVDETAIEAPFRLLISPSEEARWAHAFEPVPAEGGPGHVELWHSRLGSLGIRADGTRFINEKDGSRRIIRAIWARDRDWMPEGEWRDATLNKPDHDNSPFRMSLDGADRHLLVQQSSETIPGTEGPIEPVPVAARNLWLSGLGAWLDLHGAWNTKPYSAAHIRSILSWDHIAPLGRDQYVCVVYPGYLFPWGHQAAWVKITERKMKKRSPSLAALYQRKFLVIGEPRRVYADRHNLPFTEVSIRPLKTPPLDEPNGDPGDNQDQFFWPRLKGQRFPFVIDALDHAGRPVRLQMPLLWVAEHYDQYGKVQDAYTTATDDPRKVGAQGQEIAFAPQREAGDTRLSAVNLYFAGTAALGTSTPRMTAAEVRVPAVEALSPAGPVPIGYHDLYQQGGFGDPANPGEVWAQMLVQGAGVIGQVTGDPSGSLSSLRFGKDAPSASDRSGGFLTPDIPIRGLSRRSGVVGDTAGAAQQTFEPAKYFADAEPKLFGLIPLSELALKVDSDLLKAPQVIAGFVGRIEGLIDGMGEAGKGLARAMAEANDMLASAEAKKPDVRAQWIQQAQDAIDAVTSAENLLDQVQERLEKLVKMVTEGNDPGSIQNQFLSLFEQWTAAMDELAAKLPPFMGKLVRATAEMLKTFIGDAARLAMDIQAYVKGLSESGSLVRVRFEWKPEVGSWPDETKPLLRVKNDSLTLGVQVMAGLGGRSEAHVLAELRDFSLHLFPGEELLTLVFSRFSFTAAGNAKPELDVVIDDIGFKGVLGFIEDLKSLIPLDGFSDPPEMDVTPEGLKAGFSLALPDIALGMFSITNLSLNADVQVPFLGKAVTVGFGFCSRDRPFTLAVAFLGGGGWCGIRASADGLEVLEVGLEAGACIAVNLGVASGSVSAMIGVYIRIESEAGSLTGYYRLRGEVDVLGLISAAIELYLALVYHYDVGKLVGEASIKVNVSVVGISKTVTITARRTFAGSNGDPSFLEVMQAKTGHSVPWNRYCMAFQEE